MTGPASRWSEVGEKLEALGLKLKLHFEQAGEPAEASDAFRKLGAAAKEAFDAAGNAVRDDAVKADVKETGILFVEAMSASLAKVSETLRSDRPSAPATPPADSSAADSSAAKSDDAPKPVTPTD